MTQELPTRPTTSLQRLAYNIYKQTQPPRVRSLGLRNILDTFENTDAQLEINLHAREREIQRRLACRKTIPLRSAPLSPETYEQLTRIRIEQFGWKWREIRMTDSGGVSGSEVVNFIALV